MFAYSLNSPIICKDDSGNNTVDISIISAGESATIYAGPYTLIVTVSFEASAEVSDNSPGVYCYSSYKAYSLGSDSDTVSLVINDTGCIPKLELHMKGENYSYAISADVVEQSLEVSLSVPYDSGTLTVSVKVASNKHPSAEGPVPVKNESTHRSWKFRPTWKQIAAAAGMAFAIWRGGVGGQRYANNLVCQQ